LQVLDILLNVLTKFRDVANIFNWRTGWIH
jgi:hypothetical protein